MRQTNVTERSADVRGSENMIQSLRTQMRIQQEQAEELARTVIELFSNVPTPSVQKAVALAAGILA